MKAELGTTTQWVKLQCRIIHKWTGDHVKCLADV